MPHHLIDILDPTERFSAADFCEARSTVMDAITAAGRVPLLVGGTMLYFKALKEGLSDLPEADPAIRLVIDTMAQEVGWPAMHEQLERLDPDTAERLDPNDAQRIQRALEVIYVTDRPLSALVRERKPRRAAVPRDRGFAGAIGPQCAPCAHRGTLRGDAGARTDRRVAPATSRFPSIRPALDALRRLPADVGLPRREVFARAIARDTESRRRDSSRSGSSLG